MSATSHRSSVELFGEIETLAGLLADVPRERLLDLIDELRRRFGFDDNAPHGELPDTPTTD